MYGDTSVTIRSLNRDSKYWFAVDTFGENGIANVHRIREMLKDKAPQMLKESVLIDETYVGGSLKNKHKSKLAKLKKEQNSKASGDKRD